jgi:hypothetical protein
MPGSAIVSSLPGIGLRRARVREGPDLEQRDGQLLYMIFQQVLGLILPLTKPHARATT